MLLPLVPEHVSQRLSRKFAEVVTERLDDLQQDVDSEAVCEVDAEVLDNLASRDCALRLLCPDGHLPLNPLKQGQDALEAASEEDVVTDAE